MDKLFDFYPRPPTLHVIIHKYLHMKEITVFPFSLHDEIHIINLVLVNTHASWDPYLSTDGVQSCL